jgi:diaminobutyrate-2-oxoglutarate transaminase
VTATAALEFWTADGLEKETVAKGEQVEAALKHIAAEHVDAGPDVRGRGLARGIAFEDTAMAGQVCTAAFDRNLLLETSGPEGEVVKLLPPLTATRQELAEGLEILGESVTAVRELQPA